MKKKFVKIERDEIGTSCNGRPGILSDVEINIVRQKIIEQHRKNITQHLMRLKSSLMKKQAKILILTQVRGFIHHHTNFATAADVDSK